MFLAQMVFQYFFNLKGSGMDQIDISSPTQVEKTQACENYPMKRSKDISEMFKEFVKVARE